MVLQFLLLHPSFSRQQLFSSSHNCRAFKLYERLDQIIELMIKKEGMESTVDTTYKVGLSSTHFCATTEEVGIHGSGEAKIGFNGMCAGKKICQLLVQVISYPKWYGIKIFIQGFSVKSRFSILV